MIWPTRAGIGLCVVRDILGHADISGQAKVQQTTFRQARQAGWAGISGGVRAISGICGPPSYRGIIRGWGGNPCEPPAGSSASYRCHTYLHLHLARVRNLVRSIKVQCLEVPWRADYRRMHCKADYSVFSTISQCIIVWLPVVSQFMVPFHIL